MTYRADLYAWLVLPYVSMTIFVVGHIWRYRRDKFGWNSRSSQLLDGGRLQSWGSNLFHYGAFAVIFGHVLGILVPRATWDLVMSEHTYHEFAGIAGALSGVILLTGLGMLTFRRAANRRIRVVTPAGDVVVFVILGLMILTGLAETIGNSLIGSYSSWTSTYAYRTTISPWFRDLFYDPHPSLMANVPILWQLHAAFPWLLYAVWPFSRLVHAWSVPVQYLARPYILYRSRYQTQGASSAVRTRAK